MRLQQVFYLIFVAALISGCISPQTAPAPSPNTNGQAGTNSAQHTFRVCYIEGSSAHASAHYAAQKQIFAKHGVGVEIFAMSSAPKAATAMLAGEVDICLMSGTPVINATLAGGDLVMIGGLFNSHLYSLFVTSDIQTMAELKGKNFAISEVGGAVDAVTRVTLQHFGLEPEKDVTLLPIGGQTDRVAALEASQVVGTMVTPPSTVKLAQKGYRRLFETATLQVAYPYVSVATSKAQLHKDRAGVVAFMKALIEAIAKMKTDRVGTIEVMANYLLLDVTQDKAELDEAYEYLVLQNLEKKPYPTVAGVQGELTNIAVENPKAAEAKVDDFIDPSLVQELDDAGWIDQLYQ